MPTSDHKITLDDAEVLLRSRMGLIFGPGITVGGDFFAKLAQDLALKWGGQSGQRYTQSGQHALANGADAEEIKKAIHSSLKSESSFPHLGRVANLKWSAALSFTLDSDFERELRRACERKPSGFTATQVNDFPQVLPLKTVPVFKLLGALDGSDFAFSEIAYVARRPRWRYAVHEFADKVKCNPVVCLGLVGCYWLLLDLLSQILSEPKTMLSPLLFVESEFDANTRNDVIALTKNRIQIAFIDAPLTDLVSRMKDVEDAGATLPLPFRKPTSELDHFVPFQDIVAPVNAQLVSQIGCEETARLVDLLFSPTLPRWDPFYHKLDFRRSLGTRMLDSLLKLAVASRNPPAFALVGSAASGKTTVAKRVAYDLAARGTLFSGLGVHFIRMFKEFSRISSVFLSK